MSSPYCLNPLDRSRSFLCIECIFLAELIRAHEFRIGISDVFVERRKQHVTEISWHSRIRHTVRLVIMAFLFGLLLIEEH
mmetsp:Transcript_17177/g.32520  ORF Transcript_17177/g.32520 Transcript_17177/m.32520 type:complete len:80 (-) Transcript_17177:195-434(-)